jgi:hypothetical protein
MRETVFRRYLENDRHDQVIGQISADRFVNDNVGDSASFQVRCGTNPTAEQKVRGTENAGAEDDAAGREQGFRGMACGDAHSDGGGRGKIITR